MERKEAVRAARTAVAEQVAAARRGMAAAFDVTRIGVLGLVAAAPARPREIGAELGIAPSSVTRHVQALEDAGHVAVRPDPDDARTCIVEITPAGHAELATVDAVGERVFDAVLAGWSVEDIATLSALVSRLTRDWAEHGRSARRAAAPAVQPRWRHRPAPPAPGGTP